MHARRAVSYRPGYGTPAAPARATGVGVLVGGALVYIAEWVVLSQAAEIWRRGFSVVGRLGQLDTLWLPLASLPGIVVLFVCVAFVARHSSLAALGACIGMLLLLAGYAAAWTHDEVNRVKAGDSLSRTVTAPLPLTASPVRLDAAAAVPLAVTGKEQLVEVGREGGTVFVFDVRRGLTYFLEVPAVRPATNGSPDS